MDIRFSLGTYHLIIVVTSVSRNNLVIRSSVLVPVNFVRVRKVGGQYIKQRRYRDETQEAQIPL